MKKLLTTAAVLISVVSIQAKAKSYKYECQTDTSKKIVLEYSYNNGYILDGLTIDEQSFRESAEFSVTRGSGIIVRVSNFRNSDPLDMTLNGSNSTYRIGQGSIRSMSCADMTPRASRNDGI